MATGEMAIRWCQAAGDRLNAILVKETRQALKSRQFIATFLLMLMVSWLISAFGIVLFGAGVQYHEAGREFFAAYFLVLSVAIFVIVPFTAYRSLLSERDLNTFELLSITTLSPRRIVWGKLLSSMVQLFIYYSAIAPFIAFTYCLNGITVTMIAFLLIASLVVSVEFSMVSLMLSTFARQRQTQVLLSMLLLSGLIGAFVSSITTVPAMLMQEFSFDDPDFWWVIAIWMSYLVPFFVLALQIATAQLTFESGNRSSGIRVTCSVIFWITLAWVGGWMHWAVTGGVTSTPPAHVEPICWVAVAMLLWFGLVGLFAVTEDERFTHRVRRDLPRSRILRVIAWPFLPGGSRGLACVLIHLGLLWAASAYLIRKAGGADRIEQITAAAVACYVVGYLGFGALLGRSLRRALTELRSPHTRVVVFFLAACGSLFPHLLQISETPAWTWSPIWFITDPFFTTARLRADTAAPWTLRILESLAAVAVIVNLPAMYAGLLETLAAPSVARQKRWSHLESNEEFPAQGVHRAAGF